MSHLRSDDAYVLFEGFEPRVVGLDDGYRDGAGLAGLEIRDDSRLTSMGPEITSQRGRHQRIGQRVIEQMSVMNLAYDDVTVVTDHDPESSR